MLARRPRGDDSPNPQSILKNQSDMLTDYLKKWRAYSVGCEYCNAIFRYLVRRPLPSLSAPLTAQNNNWIRKKLEDTRNKLVGVFQGPTASTEVYEVFTVRTARRPRSPLTARCSWRW